MQRSSKTVERGAESEERIGKGRANEFASVCRDVTTFVVAVDSDVQTKQFDKALVVTKSEESCKIVRVILVGIDGRKLALAKGVVVNSTGNVGELGNPKITLTIHNILVAWITYKSMQSSKVGPQ